MSRENSRWTFVHGSRAEGVAVYDSDQWCHSHHDSDPAHGQHHAFDLVRLHRFGELDKGVPADTPMTDRPSFKAMIAFAEDLPEIRAQRAASEFQDLGPMPVSDDWLNTPPPRKSRFAIQAGAQFSAGPPLEWIIRDVLPKAELAAIFGESGSGKSFLALDMCAAIATGEPWRGKRVKRGRALYVAAEGAAGVKLRLRALVEDARLTPEQLPDVLADAPDLRGQSKDTAELIEAIRALGPYSVIIIDTLASVTPGADECTAQDMGPVLSNCKLIHQETGAVVVLIAHSGKDQTRGLRGWSGVKAALDAEIEVTRTEETRTARISKLKDSADNERFSFKLKVIDLGIDADGERCSSCVIEATNDTASRGKQKPSGRHQLCLMQELQTMAPTGTCDVDDLIDGVLTRYGTERGSAEARTLKKNVRRSVEELIVKKLVFAHGENRVSLTSLVTQDPNATF